jgi:hypothetical protein
MALDWSPYNTPAYTASKMYYDSAQQAGNLAGAGAVGLGAAAFHRPQLAGKSVSEGIRGTGRSYYKDNVDKSQYGTYEEWVQSDQAGQYLKLAEGGANMMMQDGQYLLQQDDGSWVNMGDAGQDLSDGQFYDPYLDPNNKDRVLSPWEMHMREQMMGQDWAGGQYTYKAPKTALGALFSKERFRPRANLYRQAAFEGMSEEQQEAWKGLAGRDLKGQGVGWYPGAGLKVGAGVLGGALGALFPEKDPKNPGTNTQQTTQPATNQTTGGHALGQYIRNMWNQGGNVWNNLLNASAVNVTQNNPNAPTAVITQPTSQSTGGAGSSSAPAGPTGPTHTSIGSINQLGGYKYGIYFQSPQQKIEVDDFLKERKITIEAWKKAIDATSTGQYTQGMSGQELYEKLKTENLTINPDTGELIPYQ